MARRRRETTGSIYQLDEGHLKLKILKYRVPEYWCRTRFRYALRLILDCY